jgi:AcrR family transcriptional regulator
MTRSDAPAVERPYHHGDLRRAIVEAALDLLRETQSAEFSLRELARRAGVSHNAPYKHFAEKRDLLAAVSAAGFDMLTRRMTAQIMGLSNPRDKCRRASALTALMLRRASASRFYFLEGCDRAYPAGSGGPTRVPGGRAGILTVNPRSSPCIRLSHTPSQFSLGPTSPSANSNVTPCRRDHQARIAPSILPSFLAV